MALAQAGFGMMSGTSPFFGVNVGRGMLAGEQYMQNMLPQERARQQLQSQVQLKNAANVLASRQQSIGATSPFVSGQQVGLQAQIHYPQMAPNAAIAGATGQPPPPPFYGNGATPNAASAPASSTAAQPAFNGASVTGIPTAVPAGPTEVPGPYGNTMPYPQAVALARAISGTPQGQQWLATYGPQQSAKEVTALTTEATTAANLKTNILELETAAQHFVTGPTAEARAELQKVASTVFTSMGIQAPTFQNDTSQAQIIPKLSSLIQAMNTRIAGDAGGAMLMQMVQASTPTMSNTKGGIALLGRQYVMSADRMIAESNYVTRAVNGGQMTYQDAVNNFNRQYPPQMWWSRVDPLQMPGDMKEMKPGYVYDTGNGGSSMWTGNLRVNNGWAKY